MIIRNKGKKLNTQLNQVFHLYKISKINGIGI